MSRVPSRPFALAALFVLALVPASMAAATGISATVNRSEASIEDQLLLTITIEGSRSAEPALPELPDFEVFSRGQSTQMSFINGEMSSSVSHNFVLVPRRVGRFTIGPASVELDGQVYRSKPIEVRIVAASEQPEEERDLFLSAKVSTTQPYVGQEVVYIWRFYRRVRIGDARLEPQDFRGFLVEDLGDVREYEATVNGVQYLVSEIRKSLFPQEAGPLLIPASRLTVDVLVRSSRSRGSVFDDFFGTTTAQTKTLRSREIELEVRPLPTAPADFTGLVGQFDLQARLSKTDLEVGESATLKLTVSGSGNVQMITEPSLPELTDFKIYDDKPSGSLDRSGANLTGSRLFSKALVPLTAGELVIPPIRLTYFDPDAGEFRLAETVPITLQVAPGEGKEDLNLTEALAPTSGKVAVRILADDLLPLHTGLEGVESPWTGSRQGWLLWPGLVLPPLLFAVAWWHRRRQERFAGDSGLRRRHQALRNFRQGLQRVRRGKLPEAEVSPEMSRYLREYIGDKLGLEGAALTSAEAERALESAGLDGDWVRRTHDLLQQLEAAQYGGNPVTAEAAVSRVEELVRELERRI